MKKLTPKQLSAHLAHGDWVAMKHKDRDWKVFMYEIPNGKFEGTGYEDSIEECLESGLYWASHRPEDINENFTEYKIIKRPPTPMKKGDKCQIIDSQELRKVAERRKWDDEHKEIIGQKGLEIYWSDGSDYVIYTKDKSNWCTFPHWAVARDFSEELELSDEELLTEVKRRGLVENKEILK